MGEKKKVFVFGGAGMVGSRFIELCSSDFEIESPDLDKVDILDKEQVRKALTDFNPKVVVNFAAFTNVEKAEEESGDESGIVYKLNVQAVVEIGKICKELNIHLIQISTEYIFDGEKSDSPYTENDKPNPINWYGETKYLGEKAVGDSGCNYTIMRIAMPYTAHHELKKDIARFFLGELKEGREIMAISDQRISPILIDDIAAGLSVLIENQPNGVYQVVSPDSTSPLEFAQTIARVFGLDENLVKPVTLDEYSKNKKAKLLRYSWMDSSKFRKEFGEDILHTVEEGLRIFKDHLE